MFAVLLAAVIFCGCAEQHRARTNIDPRADDALHRMSVAIGRAKSFSFKSLTTMDEPVATGQLAQFSRDNRIAVRRPDRILAEGRQDKHALLLWYEGRNLTVLDEATHTYTALKVPGRIDDMLDEVANKHRLTLPLGDLLFADPYQILTEKVLTGRYVGQQELQGTICHHLLFTQEEIDWQIWIEVSGQPLPRRIVIDYKGIPERPRFTAVVSDWNLADQSKDDQFKPKIPKDARQVDVAQLLAAGAGA
jgi:hypothetical protein